MRTTILNTRNSLIELTHSDSDAGSWKVRRWKRFLWFKRRISSDWFLDEKQALVFAQQLKYDINEGESLT